MIKITGGELKGRSIKCRQGLGTRPSGAKVREAIFNIIGSKVIDTKWLDLFGGTGAIGIEALSRGASSVIFTEKDFTAFKQLKQNLSELKIEDKSTVLKMDAINFFNKTNEVFDVIFLDPPYASEYYEQVFKIINQNTEKLSKEGILIVEHNIKYTLPELSTLKMLKTYKYGDTGITLFSNN